MILINETQLDFHYKVYKSGVDDKIGEISKNGGRVVVDPKPDHTYAVGFKNYEKQEYFYVGYDIPVHGEILIQVKQKPV